MRQVHSVLAARHGCRSTARLLRRWVSSALAVASRRLGACTDSNTLVVIAGKELAYTDRVERDERNFIGLSGTEPCNEWQVMAQRGAAKQRGRATGINGVAASAFAMAALLCTSGCDGGDDNVGPDLEVIHVAPISLLAAVGSESIYFAEQYNGESTDLSIRRKPLRGGDVEVIAEDVVETMATSGDVVYWAKRGEVGRFDPAASATDTASLPFYSQFTPYALDVAGERYAVVFRHLLGDDISGLHYADWGGADRETRETAGKSWAVATNDTHVVYNVGAELLAERVGSTAEPTLLTSSTTGIWHAAVMHGETVVALTTDRTQEPESWKLVSVSLDGGEASVLFDAAGFCSPQGGSYGFIVEGEELAIDDDAVYVIAAIGDSDSGCNQNDGLYRIPRDGSEPVVLWRRDFAASAPKPVGIHGVDGEFVYIQTWDGGSTGYTLGRVPKHPVVE